MNLAVLSGRIGKDAETKQAGEKHVIEFTMATDEPKKNPDGSWGRDTTWHNIVCWANTTKMAERLKKGAEVTLQGRIISRQWEKDGIKHQRTEIVTNAKDVAVHKREQQPDYDGIPF